MKPDFHTVHRVMIATLSVLTFVAHVLVGVAGHPTVFKHHHYGFFAARDIVSTSLNRADSPSISSVTGGLGSELTASSSLVIRYDGCQHDMATPVLFEDTYYTPTCNIDYLGQDIYPFKLTISFEQCMHECIQYNEHPSGPACAGVVFAPERSGSADNCYLKSSLNDAHPASITLIGGVLVIAKINASPDSDPVYVPTAASSLEQSAATITLKGPTLKDTKLLGSSTNRPTKQYVKHPFQLPANIDNKYLTPGIEPDLINNFPMANDTGSWTTNTFTASKQALAAMSTKPHLSRDGGKGGTINGTHLFIFCDTAAFKGDSLIDFVSSTVATDDSMNALQGQPLSLVDNLGGWQDDVGRLRAFAPMTIGEQAYNKALSGEGYRYAVWPESSLIPLNHTHALLYAALVYDEVDMTSQAASFTTLGNTLLVVSIDSKFSPYADRVVPQLFTEAEITYGTLGGIRGWGSSGIGGMDGSIYLLGQVSNGVFVAKTSPNSYTDLSTYTYWNGKKWSHNVPLLEDPAALLLNVSVMDIDIIYAPVFKTFIMIYVTTYADNTFYYRSLLPSSVDGIILPYLPGGDENYVESILTGVWSDEKILFKAATPPVGYLYAGGLHAGYFEDDDITIGGKKALLSWTEHTDQDASSEESGYAHKTVIIDFD